MKNRNLILFLLTVNLGCANVVCQDSLHFEGQLSAWINLNPDNKLSLYTGIRYIPTLDYGVKLKNDHLIDFEGSANMNGSAGFHLFDSSHFDGRIKPYRLWARYSSEQFELRAGLQKINFGSASILRPLMWFDKLDPRDPLQLTDGVWGLLGRYYFLNNTNIWLWALYGNKDPKTWEIAPTSQKFPELGGRIQTPVPKGEAALSYHFRMADASSLDSSFLSLDEVPENRIGLDGKWDIGVGIWTEDVWIHKSRGIGMLTNQEILNAGLDYTIGVGNGLYIVYEQLLVSYDKNPFAFSNRVFFSGATLSYPLGIFDNLSAIVYCDWTNKALYNFINWKRQFNKFSFYVMAYWNPEKYVLPQQGDAGNLFSGKGFQVMFVYNH